MFLLLLFNYKINMNNGYDTIYIQKNLYYLFYFLKKKN